MEAFRAQWRSESATFQGRGENDANIRRDARTFRLIDYSEAEYQNMFDNLRVGYGNWEAQAADDIREYIAGFNAYIDVIEGDPSLLPVEYVNRGIKPGRWSVTDAMAMAAYSHVSWGSAGPGEEANAQLLRQLEERFGDQARRVFDDLRQAPNAETPFTLPAVAGFEHQVDPGSVALLDLDSLVLRGVLTIDEGAGLLSPEVPAPEVSALEIRSNALLVAARHSTTGRPIAVQGPQDGYGTPHPFNSEIAIVAPDFKARGILEVSGPYPYVAARGERYAWSITILPPDQADTFAEILCEPDGGTPTLESMYFSYKGECLAFETRSDVKRLPDGGGTYTLTSVRSVHGPVIGRATVDGVPVALAQARTMYMHEEMDYPAHAQLFSPSVVGSAADFIEIVAGTAYNIGWWYIDQKDIAGVDAGLVPIRRQGASTDLPVWSTGQWDWVGFDPETHTFQTPLKSQYPQAINGPDGVIAGWNNSSALGWPVKDEAWGHGGEHRVQLLKEPTVAATNEGPISIVDLVRIHTEAAVTDFHAQRVYPSFREFLGTVDDARLEKLLQAADTWAQAGGRRQDLNGDGVLEHGKAVAFLDMLWRPLVRDVFEPVLGADILDAAGGNLPSLNPGAGGANAWTSRLISELRFHMGQSEDPPWRTYCGTTREECGLLILAALLRAADAAAATYGEDVEAWKAPVRSINFRPTGDMAPVPPIAWQNRGTYVQVTTGR